MTTYKLTPHEPHPVTGFLNSVVGWQFRHRTIADVYEGILVIQRGGWTWDIHPEPDEATGLPTELQRMTIVPVDKRPNTEALVVHNTDWFALDGSNIVILEAEDAAENYTVEKVQLPEPPPEPEPEPEVEHEHPPGEGGDGS